MFSQAEKDRILELEPYVEITGTVILGSRQSLELLRYERKKFLPKFRAKSIIRVEISGCFGYFDYNHNAAHTPSACDIMYCLLSDANAAAESLAEFFENWGEDSLKGISVYFQCTDSREKLAKIFGKYNLSLLYRYAQGIDAGECDPIWEMHKTQQAK